MGLAPILVPIRGRLIPKTQGAKDGPIMNTWDASNLVPIRGRRINPVTRIMILARLGHRQTRIPLPGVQPLAASFRTSFPGHVIFRGIFRGIHWAFFIF